MYHIYIYILYATSFLSVFALACLHVGMVQGVLPSGFPFGLQWMAGGMCFEGVCVFCFVPLHQAPTARAKLALETFDADDKSCTGGAGGRARARAGANEHGSSAICLESSNEPFSFVFKETTWTFKGTSRELPFPPCSAFPQERGKPAKEVSFFGV